MNQSDLSYAGQVVREHDPDRFFLSMFVPPSPSGLRRDKAGVDAREDVWALFAFNYEIAKTREVVSETQLGLIRLQWWRDAIAKIYSGEVLDHLGVQALAKAIKAHDLPKDLFDTLIYAREFDLEDVCPGNMEGLLHYADFTSTPLMKLVLKVIGGGEGDPVQPVAVNYALAGILRSVLHFGRQRRCLLPQDIMNTHAVSTNKLYEGKAQDGLVEVVRVVADAFVPGIRCENRYLRASQKMAALYIGQLRRCGYDIFNPKLQSSPAFKELRVFLDL